MKTLTAAGHLQALAYLYSLTSEKGFKVPKIQARSRIHDPVPG